MAPLSEQDLGWSKSLSLFEIGMRCFTGSGCKLDRNQADRSSGDCLLMGRDAGGGSPAGETSFPVRRMTSPLLFTDWAAHAFNENYTLKNLYSVYGECNQMLSLRKVLKE